MTINYKKDPDATLDYRVDWTAWLNGDTISSSTWIVAEVAGAAGLVKSNEDNTATTTIVWLSGGTVNTRYRVTNRIVTAGGRTDDRSFGLLVGEQ